MTVQFFVLPPACGCVQIRKSKERNVESAVKEPRPAEVQNEHGPYADGLEAGAEWAKNDAKYDELERVADLRQFDQGNLHGALAALCNAVCPEDDGSRGPYIIKELFWRPRGVSDAEAAGFICGARKFFKSLEDRL